MIHLLFVYQHVGYFVKGWTQDYTSNKISLILDNRTHVFYRKNIRKQFSQARLRYRESNWHFYSATKSAILMRRNWFSKPILSLSGWDKNSIPENKQRSFDS